MTLRDACWGVVFLLFCWSAACGGSGSASIGGPALTGVAREAADVAMAEIQKRWVKTGDGWVTARWSGSSFAPVRFLRQVREIAVESAGETPVGEADKANGIAWIANVRFKRTLVREAGDPGYVLDAESGFVQRPKGQWSQWIELEPERVRVWSAGGALRVDENTWLLRGTLPTPHDFTNAGIQR